MEDNNRATDIILHIYINCYRKKFHDFIEMYLLCDEQIPRYPVKFILSFMQSRVYVEQIRTKNYINTAILM